MRRTHLDNLYYHGTGTKNHMSHDSLHEIGLIRRLGSGFDKQLKCRRRQIMLSFLLKIYCGKTNSFYSNYFSDRGYDKWY